MQFMINEYIKIIEEPKGSKIIVITLVREKIDSKMDLFMPLYLTDALSTPIPKLIVAAITGI